VTSRHLGGRRERVNLRNQAVTLKTSGAGVNERYGDFATVMLAGSKSRSNVMVRLRGFLGGKRLMWRATLLLLVFLSGSWVSSLGQNAPKLTTPRIVATFERLGQTAEIPPTTIYTPKNWGTFRISIVMVGIVANGETATFWGGGVRFTDAAGKNRPDYGPFLAELYTDIRQTGIAEFPIRAKAGKPITFDVKSFGATQGTKYNVWVVVEQLM